MDVDDIALLLRKDSTGFMFFGALEKNVAKYESETWLMDRKSSMSNHAIPSPAALLCIVYVLHELKCFSELLAQAGTARMIKNSFNHLLHDIYICIKLGFKSGRTRSSTTTAQSGAKCRRNRWRGLKISE